MASTMTPDQRAANAWWVYLLSGIVSVLFGALLLSIQLEDLANEETPTAPAYFLVVLVAAFLIAWGLAQFLGAIMVRQAHSLVYMIGGILGVVAGVLALAWPDMTLLVLVIFVGWSLIAWGVIDVLGGMAIRGLPYWWLYIVRGLISIWLGFFALHREALTIEVLVFVIGIQIILWGVGDLLVAHLHHEAKTDWMAMGRKPVKK
jgi:uncharacterized membrane protein HdeD (DUF308 family)